MEASLTKKNGVCTMDKSFTYMLSLLRNGEYTVTIKRKTQPRSQNQKGLYFIWVGHIGDCFAKELGDVFWASHDGKQWLHEHFADMFLPKIEHKVGDKTIYTRRSTETLSKAEMSSYMEKIKSYVFDEFGIQLPLPEDRYYSAFVDQYS